MTPEQIRMFQYRELVMNIANKDRLELASADLTATRWGIVCPAFGVVNTEKTYWKNCKGNNLGVVPGFGNQAFKKNPKKAMTKFLAFCKCICGPPRKELALWFHPHRPNDWYRSPDCDIRCVDDLRFLLGPVDHVPPVMFMREMPELDSAMASWLPADPHGIRCTKWGRINLHATYFKTCRGDADGVMPGFLQAGFDVAAFSVDSEQAAGKFVTWCSTIIVGRADPFLLLTIVFYPRNDSSFEYF